MSFSRLAALFCSFTTLVTSPSLLAANAYFWPEHQTVMAFKIKAHAIRGTLTQSVGPEVTIADNVYRELIVETTPERLPGFSREVFIRADEHGLYSRYSTSPEGKEVLDLALPAEVGKTWETFDKLGNPSKRVIEDIRDCQIKEAKYKACVTVSFEAPGGAAMAVFATQFGEIVYSRANGFNRQTRLSK